MVGASDEQACKRHVGRPPIIIKEVEDMVTNIRNSNNATDINGYVSDILKASSDTHLTKYLSQVQLLLSKPNIDISNISIENIERVTIQLNETSDARLDEYKELHTTAKICRDAQNLELNNLNDICQCSISLPDT